MRIAASPQHTFFSPKWPTLGPLYIKKGLNVSENHHKQFRRTMWYTHCQDGEDGLEESTVLEVVLDDHVRHRVEHKLKTFSVS